MPDEADGLAVAGEAGGEEAAGSAGRVAGLGVVSSTAM